MPSLSSTGIDLHYERTGIGTPVLLIAGMASDSASWKPVIADLASVAEVITMDNRCTGQTRPIPVETSRDLMVADVIALLDACNIDKVTLVGHSMGALISWAVAAQVPERINGLVAVSAPTTVDQTRIELFDTLAKLRTDENEAVWFRILFQFLFSPSFLEDTKTVNAAVAMAMEYEHRQMREAFARQCAALPSYLAPIELPTTLSYPSLAITGVNDKLFTPNDLYKHYASHPEIKLSVIDNAAHSVHWENPSAFNALLRSFISDQ